MVGGNAYDGVDDVAPFGRSCAAVVVLREVACRRSCGGGKDADGEGSGNGADGPEIRSG